MVDGAARSHQSRPPAVDVPCIWSRRVAFKPARDRIEQSAVEDDRHDLIGRHRGQEGPALEEQDPRAVERDDRCGRDPVEHGRPSEDVTGVEGHERHVVCADPVADREPPSTIRPRSSVGRPRASGRFAGGWTVVAGDARQGQTCVGRSRSGSAPPISASIDPVEGSTMGQRAGSRAHVRAAQTRLAITSSDRPQTSDSTRPSARPR